jgi:hypothetical protein
MDIIKVLKDKFNPYICIWIQPILLIYVKFSKEITSIYVLFLLMALPSIYYLIKSKLNNETMEDMIKFSTVGFLLASPFYIVFYVFAFFFYR